MFFLGFYYLESKEPKKAREFMEKSLHLDPDFKSPYISLSCALLQLGLYEEAARVSEVGNKRFPNTASCLYNVGVSTFGLTFRKGYSNSANWGGIPALQGRALEALEWARDNKPKDQPWTELDDTMVDVLKQPLDDDTILDWHDRLPKDGWRSCGWRP
mmetsp:Transcript_95376/g.149180  ORF Transcript_95376/g.149180 Transcript_95376/m.149180 type:complete len:158 (-) Transcript_95376:59-532(-)